MSIFLFFFFLFFFERVCYKVFSLILRASTHTRDLKEEKEEEEKVEEDKKRKVKDLGSSPAASSSSFRLDIFCSTSFYIYGGIYKATQTKDRRLAMPYFLHIHTYKYMYANTCKYASTYIHIYYVWWKGIM